MDRLLAYIFSLAILGLAALLRRETGTWGTPAGLFCLFWFLFSFVPLLAIPGVPINPLSVAYIMVACVAFSVPAMAVEWGGCHRRNEMLAPRRQHYLDGPFIWILFLGSSVLSVVFVLTDFVVQGLGLRELLFNFFASANEYLAMRYGGEIRSNLFGQFALMFAYLAATAGGLLYASHRTRRRNLVLVGAMAPAVAILLLQAAKGMFFVSIALILGGVWIYRTLTGVVPHISFRGLLSYLRYAPIVVPLVIVSFLSRGLYDSEYLSDVVEALAYYLRAYAFMHLYAFSDWLSFHLGQSSVLSYAAETPAMGYFSFISLFQMLGSEKVVPAGVYGEYFFLQGANPGNLYTIFRGLITDFGIAGSLVCMLVSGFVMNVSYRRMLMVAYPAISVAVMFVFVHALYTSYLISAFIWNTTLAVSVATILVFVVNRWSIEWRR